MPHWTRSNDWGRWSVSWRRYWYWLGFCLHAHEGEVELREFTRRGVYAVPASLGAAVPALWVSLAVIAGG
ncbi:hypothetical protein ACFV9D_00360 [Streptomyces sp. NPDC059875]|uniref:hypothetical protein n=1 Tax=unclassified Streptomyces TaxID=2593676 RepID=UPI003667BF7B